MARPKKEIDAQQVCQLARLGATHSEIADFFACERSTITKRFSPEITKGHSDLKLKLRRLQFRAAERGNVSMLIFLGKAILGQTDKPQEEQEYITVLIDTATTGKPTYNREGLPQENPLNGSIDESETC